jgi:hypothetical protein
LANEFGDVKFITANSLSVYNEVYIKNVRYEKQQTTIYSFMIQRQFEEKLKALKT